MQKLLIVLGIALIAAGLFWPWLRQVPLGRLPGDITIPLGANGRLYLPLGSCLLISVVLTVLYRLFR
ncbi:DUF2905 domain-containing protein [Maritimibacter sp. 55A14]|uniref:DUF2905 domain-containing protein n=1 Tax=Maritimibacter sp. 55A14 TaxID=2174844 RepID=UPI000D6186FC|nr:DUF2905 domain-containing protein [Maritimibacter sp. 55A14]PWE32405.1 DUF2905 domain-containing protein [Maritimibacter sp. 55A14]